MKRHESIHIVLAKSYLVHFVCSMLGLFADYFLGFEMNVPYALYIAITFFIIGPILIFWAQYTSRYVEQTHGYGKKYFHFGPYRYMRNPTHLGLLILVAGYTLVSGSLMLFLSTLIGYLVSNIFFKKYESILATTADGEYKTYRSSVQKIL